MSNIWMVRAGRDAVHIDTFIDKGVITIGMSQHVGAEAIGEARKDLMERTAKAHPEWNHHRVANHAGQLFRFLTDIAVGDEVATYDPNLRRYLIGIVTSAARHDVKLIEDMPYVRSVTWSRRVARDSLSVETRNTLGAIQTIFRLNGDASSELRKAAVPLDAPPEVEPPKPADLTKHKSLDDLREEVVEKAAEFIEDMIAALDPYEMQQFVAGILRAMGYKTRVSPKGSDRGVDIFASPDGLGLQEPPDLRRGKASKECNDGIPGDPRLHGGPTARLPLLVRQYGRLHEGCALRGRAVERATHAARTTRTSNSPRRALRGVGHRN